MDILLFKERIHKTISLGESQFREFKSAFEGPPKDKISRNPKEVAKDIAQTLAAFANADGGELLVGVEDNGDITGIEYKEEIVEYLLNAPISGVHKDTPLSGVKARVVNLDGINVIYFSVNKSTTTIHQTSDGKCLQRKDMESCPVSATQLQFERQEQISREYDRQFVDSVQVTDLNLDLIKEVSDTTVRMSPEKCLQYLGVAEYGLNVLRLKRAAVLLFSEEISKWHPRCQVRVLRVQGTEIKTGREYNVISDDRVTGNILELINKAWQLMRPHLVQTRMTEDALFKEMVMYPEDACREALINAITHRDYSYEGQNIEILIFNDRMEIRSPGSLLSTINIEELKQLKGKHDSRNALIARVLREIGYIREMGEGMRRIYRLMSDADLIPPEISTEPGEFTITLHHKSVFTEEDQRWLTGFSMLNITRDEKRIILLGKDGHVMSPKEIYDNLGLVDWDNYRQFIERMYSKGILYNTMTSNEKNRIYRQQKISKREIPRLAIRSPKEIEIGLNELYRIIRDSMPVERINNSYVSQIKSDLSDDNIYKSRFVRALRLFKILDLIDDKNNPTMKLFQLWGVTPDIFKKKQDLYVRNLEFNTTEDEVEQLFSAFGEVLSVYLPKYNQTKRNRGFGFIKMATPLEADRAIEELNGKTFRGRRISVEYSKG